MSDSLLIEQCKQNNPKAQMALYRQYCDGMFIVAQRYLKDTATAEDALQEAFIKAFKKIDQFKGDVTFGSWLKRIVINMCLDVIKSKKVELLSLHENVVHIAEKEDDWHVPDQTTMEEVYSAIEQLPYNHRIVVKLFLLEGYDHQEISEILGISESASRTNLHRGKLQLKETLKHLQYGTGY
ncbi:RNA polymerase sigma factor [Constantimarinum furrinae]|uniref:RNA polymerase sigma factor, sigma-70 family n=1 Tax=Constantimarinum furrinae TaxID=2562285 RepID=A0A7G8PQX8_9FLAO|nr:RNA polymerase sigma factor [Constantimarinum furrinae]QNJ96744.1 RNA polymerase sigma factor, sigma-70 family [Constantimarinum furrinae]